MTATTVHVKAYMITATDESLTLHAFLDDDEKADWAIIKVEDRAGPGQLAKAVDLLDVRRPHSCIETLRDLGYDLDRYAADFAARTRAASATPSPVVPVGTSTPAPSSTPPTPATTHPAPATGGARDHVPTRRRGAPQLAASQTQQTSVPGGAT